MAMKWMAVLALGASVSAWAAGPSIYSCVDSRGKKITSDRPIPECSSRDQRVLNPDGSVQKVVPPVPTADERAEQEVREREIAAQRAAQHEAVRRDRNLLLRYPNEAAHQKARTAALDSTKAALLRSQRRLEELGQERKPLLDEAEFYVGKPLPAKLKQQMESNDTAVEAQRVLIRNQEAEIDRINALFDTELARLKKLWAGAPPGSLGALPPPSASASATAAPSAAIAASGVRKAAAP